MALEVAMAGAPSPFLINLDANGCFEQVPDGCLRFLDADGDEQARWNGAGTHIPAFWTTLFAPEGFTPPIAKAPFQEAMARQRASADLWKRALSPTLWRGWARFTAWLEGARAHSIVLDCSVHQPWRSEGLFKAAAHQALFIHQRAPDPGPLLSGWTECVIWRRRRAGHRLEAAADADWPDAMPLFMGKDWRLTLPTMGQQPFRRGPWPERRWSQDALQPLPDALRMRPEQVRQAVDLMRRAEGAAAAASSGGNLQLIRACRELCESFLAAAESIVHSAEALAADYQLFDDSALWQGMVGDIMAVMAGLPAIEARIRAALEACRRDGVGFFEDE